MKSDQITTNPKSLDIRYRRTKQALSAAPPLPTSPINPYTSDDIKRARRLLDHSIPFALIWDLSKHVDGDNKRLPISTQIDHDLAYDLFSLHQTFRQRGSLTKDANTLARERYIDARIKSVIDHHKNTNGTIGDIRAIVNETTLNNQAMYAEFGKGKHGISDDLKTKDGRNFLDVFIPK